MEKSEGRTGLETYKQVSQTYDNSTGEIVAEEIVTKVRVSREPDFIKLYLADVLMVQDISKDKTSILYELLKRMNYSNEIVLVVSIKREIGKKLGYSLSTVDKALSTLVEKNILTRKDRGIFIANPFLFGKGKWEDIQKLRLSIDYDKEGKRITTVITTIDDYLPE